MKGWIFALVGAILGGLVTPWLLTGEPPWVWSTLFSPAIPKNSILAFDQRGCPDGWGKFDEADGHFLLASSSKYPYGSKGGKPTVTLTTEQMPEHSHIFTGISVERGGWGGSVITDKIAVGDNGHQPSWEPTGSISAEGRGLPHNNMPPYIALTYCKKLSG